MAPTLQNIHDYLRSLDPQDSLQGTSFHLDTNNALGFDPGDSFDFYVATPFGRWSNTSPPTPNVLASATQLALEAAIFAPPTIGGDGQKYVFIDLTTFGHFSTEFWYNGIGPKLGELVNSLPDNVNPVIRLIAGAQDASDASFQDSDNQDQGWTVFKQLFWPKNKALIRHPSAHLFLGFYNPAIDSLLASSVMPDWEPQFAEEFEAYLAGAGLPDSVLPFLNKDILPLVVNDLVPSISWNHAKITAVNGTRMTTGGANLWDEYGDGQTGIFDSAVKIQGDATVQAHKYVDTLSSYLNNIPFTDGASFRRSIPLARPAPDKPHDFGTDAIPLFTTTTGATNSGVQSVLSVNNIGDHLPLGLRYPINTINAIRDALLQIAYMECSKYSAGMGIMNDFINALSDASILPPLLKYGLTPAVWASKASYLHTISRASSEIILAQQFLANGSLVGLPGAEKLKAFLLNNLGLEWDQYLVPYDLISALCDGLIQIATNYPHDTKKGIYILLSTKDNADGYPDPYAFSSFRQILLTLLGAKTLPNGVTVADLDQRIFCRRIMGNDSKYGHHSKVICIDRSLLFVGSDNIYPQYNEQHGVWIDDRSNIGAWYNEYFTGAWNRGADATD